HRRRDAVVDAEAANVDRVVGRLDRDLEASLRSRTLVLAPALALRGTFALRFAAAFPRRARAELLRGNEDLERARSDTHAAVVEHLDDLRLEAESGDVDVHSLAELPACDRRARGFIVA